MSINTTQAELDAQLAAREAGRRMAAPIQAHEALAEAVEATTDAEVSMVGMTIGGEPIPTPEDAREALGDMRDAGAQVVTEDTTAPSLMITRSEAMDAVLVCAMAVKFGAVSAGNMKKAPDHTEGHRVAFMVGDVSFYADFPALATAQEFAAALRIVDVAASVYATAKGTIEVEGFALPDLESLMTEGEREIKETTDLARACGAVWVGEMTNGEFRGQQNPRVSWTLNAAPDGRFCAVFNDLDRMDAFMKAMDHRRGWRGLCRTIPHGFPGAEEFMENEPKDEDEDVSAAIMEGFRDWMRAEQKAHRRRAAIRAGAGVVIKAAGAIGSGVALGAGFALGLVGVQSVFHALGF